MSARSTTGGGNVSLSPSTVLAVICDTARLRNHLWLEGPRRFARAPLADSVLKGFDIVVPESSLRIVRFADLPIAMRILQALRETGELLILANVKEELQDRRPVLGRQG